MRRGRAERLADEANGFEADGYNLADEADDVLGIVVAVGVIDYAGALVGGDAVLIEHPFEGAAVAEAVFVDFGQDAASHEQRSLSFYPDLRAETVQHDAGGNSGEFIRFNFMQPASVHAAL